MTEKYEAHAYIKVKGEENKEETMEEVKKARDLICLLGETLFKHSVQQVYDEGMRVGYTTSDFMVLLTELFIGSTVSYYMSTKSEQEIIAEVTSFLEAVKTDTSNSIRHVFETRKKYRI